MAIRACTPLDLTALTAPTIETFRPLLAGTLVQIRAKVTAHDQGHWEDDHRPEVPSLLALNEAASSPWRKKVANRSATSAGTPPLNPPDDWRWLRSTRTLADAESRGRSEAALPGLEQFGVSVVHSGTGGDEFHAPLRVLDKFVGFIPYPTVDYARTL